MGIPVNYCSRLRTCLCTPLISDRRPRRKIGFAGILSPAALSGWRGLSLNLFFGFLLLMLFPAHAPAHDLVAITASGKSYLLASVEKDVKTLVITCRDSGITLGDPVVDVRGFGELENLRDLRFYQVPQIESFGFLDECASLEKLSISFGRVRNVDFLHGMPDIRVFHLEFCGDWESNIGLPFLAEPLDLSENLRLEYLAFRICDLKRVPILANVPDTLQFVDLSYNAMEIGDLDTPALEAMKDVRRVFLAGNLISAAVSDTYGNLTLEHGESVLSEFLAP